MYENGKCEKIPFSGKQRGPETESCTAELILAEKRPEKRIFIGHRPLLYRYQANRYHCL